MLVKAIIFIIGFWCGAITLSLFIGVREDRREREEFAADLNKRIEGTRGKL